MWGQVYCVLTNLAAIVPARALYMKRMFVDAVFVGVTGLASILYHANNAEPVSLIGDVFDHQAIRDTDVILANLLVFHTTHMLVCRNRDSRHWMTMAMLPVTIYTNHMSLLVREVMFITYGGLGIIYAAANRRAYDARMLIFGTLSVTLDLVFFMWLGQTYEELYYWYHGTHHIFGFLTVYGFGLAPNAVTDGETQTRVVELEEILDLGVE